MFIPRTCSFKKNIPYLYIGRAKRNPQPLNKNDRYDTEPEGSCQTNQLYVPRAIPTMFLHIHKGVGTLITSYTGCCPNIVMWPY